MVIALHGTYGEDGAVQGLLEVMGLPYTGSGVAASAICMDKAISKRLFADGGLPTPPWRELRIDDPAHAPDHIDGLSFPLFIKPLANGSSVGVSRANDADGLKQALAAAAEVSPRVLAEQAITGRELTLTILDGEALPLIEIRPKEGFYDYRNKYTKGCTEYLIPPPGLDEAVARRVGEIGVAAYHALGCHGLARVDFMLDADDAPWLLEANTIPGLTELSLAPQSAAAAGIPFDELAERILASAWSRA
ncbi:putative D-alanine--D-alanine ligase [Magnetofaba australis IT-1]|uniref:D-alanine--D-alanine ligase n=1 Tax=Magnetofaba australis IT-1 TaxID=1434232 RepID=A0A1Y2K985_9PROT|nr:putative D-alanine--D-alanine ligase [Magnetofaba australis IT-1]